MPARERSTPTLEARLEEMAGPRLERAHAPRVPLSGRRVRLRPVMSSDYEFLFRLATDDRTAAHWRYLGMPPRPEDFVRDLWQGVLTQFLVEHLESRERLGLVVAYEANLRDSHCHLGAIFRSDTRVWPLEAVVLFVNLLFQEFNFVKIYCDVIDYNLPNFASAVGRWLVREGLLVEHTVHAGRRWDVHLLALWRDRFERDRRRLLARIAPEHAT